MQMQLSQQLDHFPHPEGQAETVGISSSMMADTSTTFGTTMVEVQTKASIAI
jgi:hypothetical protein